MANIILENGFTFEGNAGAELLDATIIDTLDQTEIMPEYKMYKAMLNYTEQPIINPDQAYSARYANGGLARKEERGNKKERGINFGPKKGIYQQVHSEKFNITEELTEWIRSSNSIAGAPERIQGEYIDIQKQVKDLVDGYDITWADLLVRVCTKGFSISAAEGPGSATPKGKALFANDHSVLRGDGTTTTYDNFVADGAIDYDNTDHDVAIQSGVTNLQAMLDTLKNSTLDNGRKIRQPGAMGYNLYCSRQRETFWREVLNNGQGTSAVGSNEGIANQFLFNNNVVNLMVIDTLGDYDDVEGELIGNNNMVFVSNPMYIQSQECFKCYELYSPKIKTWMNEDTDEIFTSLKCSIGADHYYAEYWLVGYRHSA